MKFTLSARLALLASTAINCGIGEQAFAQAQAQANPATSGALEEVVVTSTRQASTVNRVPLSVSAVTQQSLDQQGIKTVADLQRSVPALQFTRDSAGSGNFAIRGIISNTGAATTGIYLDDTPLQKRRVNGGGNAANGAPTPPLFDLERVEVLRGPQGTLYGGSSEGGTIRFITPSPSLTSYSAYARAELSHVDSGEAGYEAGLAVGGPIVRDKLGFRASVFGKHTAGYVDVVDPYHNGAVLYPDSNSQETKVGRLALAWAPTDRSRVTGSIYHSEVKDHGGPPRPRATTRGFPAWPGRSRHGPPVPLRLFRRTSTSGRRKITVRSTTSPNRTNLSCRACPPAAPRWTSHL
jgi:iron complex outermembrane receptor protein